MAQEKCHQRHCKHDVNLNYITSDGLNKQSTTHFPQSECLSHRIAFLKRLKSRQLGRARRFSWCLPAILNVIIDFDHIKFWDCFGD